MNAKFCVKFKTVIDRQYISPPPPAELKFYDYVMLRLNNAKVTGLKRGQTSEHIFH